MFKDGGDGSEEPVSVSSSSLGLCPSYLAPLSPWIHAENLYSPIFMFKWHTVTVESRGEDQHTVLN